jgi:hypothetical protein
MVAEGCRDFIQSNAVSAEDAPGSKKAGVQASADVPAELGVGANRRHDFCGTV